MTVKIALVRHEPEEVIVQSVKLKISVGALAVNAVPELDRVPPLPCKEELELEDISADIKRYRLKLAQ